jgi:Arc/MetJ family transcription regulator
MATHMKTTIEIGDELLAKAKDVARRERTTLRALFEEGLRWVLTHRLQRAERFTLRDAGVSGRGVRPGLDEGDWAEIQEVIYRGRGS